MKPVQGADGNRVPLLRPGFRPNGPYIVSFVFMHSGTPFEKKGGADLTIPSMDIPISLLNWEVFLPERYKVKDFGGDVIAANRVPEPLREEATRQEHLPRDMAYSSAINLRSAPMQSPAGQIGGYVTDQSGAVVAGAQVTVTSSDTGMSHSTATDANGHWTMLGLPSGNYKLKLEGRGFNTSVNNIRYDATQPSMYGGVLSVGATTETIEVTATAPQLETSLSSVEELEGRNFSRVSPLAPGAVSQSASANVVNLQKKVAGVLPVPIDVPRAGTSFSFVRPLVLDEETKVTFSYKSR